MSDSRFAPQAHGGDLVTAAEHFGIPVPDWLDLSTGINPVPYPLPPLGDWLWERLPPRDLQSDLLEAAAAYYGVDPRAAVVPAPGTQALIQSLPTLLPSTKVSVLGPTYGEHAAAWRAAGHETRELFGLEECGDASVCVVVNPNNPDGRTFGAAPLVERAAVCAARGGFLVVDEAFADPVPEASVANVAACAGLIVLRSFGKFFGLAGVRLGFALTSPRLGAAIAQRLGPWAVSGPALEIGRRAMRDEDWAAATRTRLRADATTLDEVLARAGLRIIGGTPLFRLARIERAQSLFEHLGRKGVLTRAFFYRSDWLRVGLPADATALARLAAALGGFRPR